jgi:hypothetical protein
MSGIVFAVSCIITVGDNQRVRELGEDLKAHYDFVGSTLYYTGLSRSDHISIYGDYTPSDVEDILKVATDSQARRSTKKSISLKFYRRHHDNSSLYNEVIIK